MSRRVNIMMDDDAWRVIEQLPRGARSRAVNSAIREWSGASVRREAAARMDALRAPAASGRHGRRGPLDTRGAGATAVVIVTPDASVLLKWVLPGDDEQDGDAALSLCDEAGRGPVVDDAASAIRMSDFVFFDVLSCIPYCNDTHQSMTSTTDRVAALRELIV